MTAIWKYELAITDEQTVSVPGGARPLSVAEKDGKLCMWCVVTPANWQRQQSVKVSIYGTGNPMPDRGPSGNFLGTVVMGNGLAWHVFVG